MKIYLKYITLFIFLCVHSNVNAQVNKTSLPKNVQPVKSTKQQTVIRSNNIVLIAATVGGKILLRWAPGSPELFQQGSKYGYKIERIPLQQYVEGNESASFQNARVLNSVPLLPIAQSDSSWNKIRKRNKDAVFIQHYLFGLKTKATEPDKKAKDDVVFGLALKACEYDFKLADMAGLAFIDSVSKGEYAYRITLNKTDVGIKYSAGVTTANVQNESDLSFSQPVKIKASASTITLDWNATKQKNIFGAFNIERGTDATNFTRINSAPIVFVRSQFEAQKTDITYADSIKETGKKFYYRIKGISFFGFEGKPSEIVSAVCKQSLDGYPFIDSAVALNSIHAAVYFHHSPEIKNTEIKSISCARSEKEKGPYSGITFKISESKNYLVTDEQPLSTNYYKIAYDLGDGDTIWSAPVFVKIPDVSPPAVPAGLKGNIDSAGTVKLNWEKNTEQDLMGYRVFRSNNLKEEFVEVTKKIDDATSYSEKLSLNNLTEEIYYKITAVDRVYNNSPYSGIIKLKKPDKIAPLAPVLTKLTHTDTTINLEFIASGSSDISKHIVLRKNSKSGKSDTVMLTGSGEPKLKVSDNSAMPGNTYLYEIKAIDDDGNFSVVKSGEIVFQPKYFAAMKDVRARADREKRNVVIEWTYRADEVYSFLVYKAKKGEKFKLIETLPGGKQLLIDKEVHVNNVYEYRVKAVLKSGSETKMSIPVEVIY